MLLKHFDHDGRARFITFCTHLRIPLLTNNRFRQIVVNSLDEMHRNTGILLLGYVIMPEHIHLVVVPPLDVKLGERIGDMKRRSAQEILSSIDNQSLLRALTVHRDGRHRQALWQRRCFDHNCRNDNVVCNKIRYCHMNPVRRGLAHCPGDYPWSSYRWYHGLGGVMLNLDASGVAI